MEELEILAKKLGDDKIALKKRLLETRSVLADWSKKYFKTYEYDFENKRLIGSDGFYLQWQVRFDPDLPAKYDNQQTSKGTVLLRNFNYD